MQNLRPFFNNSRDFFSKVRRNFSKVGENFRKVPTFFIEKAREYFSPAFPLHKVTAFFTQKQEMLKSPEGALRASLKKR